MAAHNNADIIHDRQQVIDWLANSPDTERVKHFVPGPGLQKLKLTFNINKLQSALKQVTDIVDFGGDDLAAGFGAIQLNRRPGVTKPTSNDLSGRYWLRADERYIEEAKEEIVDEAAFTEFDPRFEDTYFKEVLSRLAEVFTLGRARILSKGLYNCNSWHRDPEPRIHIPIVSNPGSLFVVNNHCTHLPADGSVYFTDTRGYHTALNGGLYNRVHLVVALPLMGT